MYLCLWLNSPDAHSHPRKLFQHFSLSEYIFIEVYIHLLKSHVLWLQSCHSNSKAIKWCNSKLLCVPSPTVILFSIVIQISRKSLASTETTCTEQILYTMDCFIVNLHKQIESYLYIRVIRDIIALYFYLCFITICINIHFLFIYIIISKYVLNCEYLKEFF